MFYDRFEKLCSDRGLSPSRVAIEAGINKSTVTYWKNTPEFQPSGTVIKKLSEYFGITRSELLGEEKKEKAPTETGERAIDDDDIKLALFGGDGEVTDAMWDEALFAIQLIKERHKREKEKNG